MLHRWHDMICYAIIFHKKPPSCALERRARERSAFEYSNDFTCIVKQNACICRCYANRQTCIHIVKFVPSISYGRLSCFLSFSPSLFFCLSSLYLCHCMLLLLPALFECNDVKIIGEMKRNTKLKRMINWERRVWDGGR